MSTAFQKQHMVLTLPITQPVYYFAQKNGESQRVEGTEKNRHDLLQAVADGAVRKVLVKYDVSLVEEGSLEDILEQLQEALVALEPYYWQPVRCRKVFSNLYLQQFCHSY